jgi:hypothetical protein
VTTSAVVIEDSPDIVALPDVAAETGSSVSRTLSPGNDADYDGPRCQFCDGPCWQWKGTVHGYTCGRCLDAYLDAAVARAEAQEAKERAKRARKNHPDPAARPGARHTVDAAAAEVAPGRGHGLLRPGADHNEK